MNKKIKCLNGLQNISFGKHTRPSLCIMSITCYHSKQSRHGEELSVIV